jgi:hypothetical protein
VIPKVDKKMWIMVAGPYSSNAASEDQRVRNLQALNAAALRVFDKGHVPVVGVNLALPIISTAQDRHADIMMPLSLALADRCDACLRINGVSAGADREVERFRAAGKPVYFDLDELPVCAG